MWDKVFINGRSKVCRRQPLKNLKGYGLPTILEYFVPYLTWGVVVVVYEKTQNQNERSVIAQSCQSRWILFLDLELEQAPFYLKNLSSSNTTDLTYLSYVIARKSLVIFFQALRHL